jgi:hypothetical protein
MKRIIDPADRQEVTSQDLEGNEIVAYRCLSSKSICVLSKLLKDGTFGFVNLSRSNIPPAFVGYSFYQSIDSATKNRKLFVFANQSALIEAIYLKKL